MVESGKSVGMFADDPDLTLEQASELLEVSRPIVVQRITSGEVKARMVGAHHRIRMSDAMEY